MSNNNKIRILHISNGDDCLGSAQCLYEILRYEIESGEVEPIVLTPHHTGMNDFCDNNGIENYSVKYCGFMYPKHDKRAQFKYWIRKMEYIAYNSKSVKLIENIFDINNIDIIHTNNSLNDIGSKLALKYNKSHVWHLREAGLYPQNLHPYFHGFADSMTKGNPSFIAVSNSVKAEWVKLGISENLIHVIYDGVELPNTVYKKEKSELTRFVMTGAYSEIKGQIQIVLAVAALPDDYRKKLIVDFWGNGVAEYVNYLKQEIFRLGLEETIKLKGFSNNIWETISNYDVGLNCTRLEAFGRTTAEFLISGIPVIASNLGANIELINDVNGKFYEYSNIDELKECIIHMVDNLDEYNCDKISEYAKKHYSCDISNQKIIQHFRAIFEGGNKW